MLGGWRNSTRLYLSSSVFFCGTSTGFYPPNSWAQSSSGCYRVTLSC